MKTTSNKLCPNNVEDIEFWNCDLNLISNTKNPFDDLDYDNNADNHICLDELVKQNNSANCFKKINLKNTKATQNPMIENVDKIVQCCLLLPHDDNSNNCAAFDVHLQNNDNNNNNLLLNKKKIKKLLELSKNIPKVKVNLNFIDNNKNCKLEWNKLNNNEQNYKHEKMEHKQILTTFKSDYFLNDLKPSSLTNLNKTNTNAIHSGHNNFPNKNPHLVSKNNNIDESNTILNNGNMDNKLMKNSNQILHCIQFKSKSLPTLNLI